MTNGVSPGLTGSSAGRAGIDGVNAGFIKSRIRPKRKGHMISYVKPALLLSGLCYRRLKLKSLNNSSGIEKRSAVLQQIVDLL